MQETETVGSDIKLRRYLIPLKTPEGHLAEPDGRKLAEKGFTQWLASDFSEIWEKTLNGGFRIILFYDAHIPVYVMPPGKTHEILTAYYTDLLFPGDMSHKITSDVAEKTIRGELGNLFEIAHPISTTR